MTIKIMIKIVGEIILCPLWLPIFVGLLVCKIAADKMEELNEWNMEGRK
jgi:hypothetical protein